MVFSGTASGDPTEANWVGAEFKRDDELALGSVKGNVGYVHEALRLAAWLANENKFSHLEITAFLASLCKTCIWL